MPQELSASEIEVRIGATWIEPEIYTEFMFELLSISVNFFQQEVSQDNIWKFNTAVSTLNGSSRVKTMMPTMQKVKRLMERDVLMLIA